MSEEAEKSPHVAEVHRLPPPSRAFPPPPDAGDLDEGLKHGGGGGTFGGMDHRDVHGRLSRLEGGASTQQWAVGVVSASLLAAMAIVIAITLALWGSVTSLSGKVDALPEEIRQELQSLTREMQEAFQAGRAAGATPSVVVIPQGVYDAAPATPTDQSGETPTE